MPGRLPEPFELLLWVAAALVAVWVFVPMLCVMLRLSWVRQTVVGGPEALEPAGDDPQYADLFDRLLELGFEPLGARVEKGVLCNQHWFRAYPPGRVFATPGRDCFALLFRIFSGHPWRLCFTTVLADGTHVQTSNQMPNLRIEQEGYFRWGHPTPDVAELLRLHRGVAEDYRAARGLAVASPDLRDYCEGAARHSQRYLRAKGPALGLRGLTVPLVFVAMTTFIGGYYVGFNRTTVLIAFILACTAYRVLHPFSVRDTARKIYAADEARGLARQWARQRRAGRASPN